MAPPSDPVADVWHSPELLGHVFSFLCPTFAAWSLIRVNKAAAAAFDSNGQPVSRTVSLSAAIKSGLLAAPEARLQARAMCRRLTRRQRVELLCRCVAADCSREGLEGAVVAAGLSPPPLEVLIAAASAGRLATCRWLVEVLGCPGLVRLACLCLISAAGPGPAVGREARAWLAPAAAEGWSEEQEAKAASGDLGAVDCILWGWEPEDANVRNTRTPWTSELGRLKDQRDLAGPGHPWMGWSLLATRLEFYQGPHAALAVTRLTQMGPKALDYAAVHAAAVSGHVEAVRHLLSHGVGPGGPWLGGCGNVGLLQALHEAGCMAEPARCFSQAVEKGSLPAVEWLLETFGAAALEVDVFTAYAAARSGSVTLLKALPGLLDTAAPGWDRCRSSRWTSAAESGCEEAVELLFKTNTPAQDYHRAFRDAASHGDLHMMQCLRKLGCPYSDEAAEALAQAASRVPASASTLPWLEAPLNAAVWKAMAAYAEAVARTEAGVETAVCFTEHVVSLSYMVVDVGLCLAGMLEHDGLAVPPHLVPILDRARCCEPVILLLLLAIWALVWTAPPRHHYEPSFAQMFCSLMLMVLALALFIVEGLAGAVALGSFIRVVVAAAICGRQWLMI
ncbi:hypothetical protein HYH03_012930 [Edaphochlamys debaryana]|uniref:Uncharacterized protein n=1 Tax=Edaphochlamys debaryana TaxID=47281 RepID=A0A835XSY5_9CHLO|nr:hypothetical protein HYH03_012930 [Edaphochlamys debaryana]|eukprot:KAG2488423.1 hypothetical protein HYH03_012930 [Edaphochlamys debaryana]